MFGGSARSARGLRACRACGSRAIAGPYVEKLEDDSVQLSVRCGECGTWRWAVLPAERADAVDRRLRRTARRGQRDIEDELRRLRLTGMHSSPTYF